MNRKALILLFFLVIVIESWAIGGQDTGKTQRDLTTAQRELEEANSTRAKAQDDYSRVQLEMSRVRGEWANSLVLEREARFMPITQEIIDQVAEDEKSLKDLAYYVSMPVLLVFDDTLKKMDINDGEVTYQEQNSSQQVEIDITSKGSLVNEPGFNNDIFEVFFFDEKITLNFSKNRAKNRFDLTSAVTDSGTRHQLRFTGAVPHLLIYYKAKFSGQVIAQGFSDDDLIPMSGTAPGRMTRQPEKADSVTDTAPPAWSDSTIDAGSSVKAGPAKDAGPVMGVVPVTSDDIGFQWSNQKTSRIQDMPVMAVTMEDITSQGPDYKTYRLQIGAFREPQNTEKALLTLRSAGFNPVSEPFEDMDRVLITGIRAEEMSGVTEKVRAIGYQRYIIREE
ncbi:hypothetical protein AGMMS49546_19060 [Spirochaetia bacterium]|nr:hypothetical protein AGMMS49546_19060 [Spirochaetia bacterium]